jgi:SAM-dependent methyltransferase
VGLALALKVVNVMDPAFGGDSQEHLYKIDLLAKQMEQENPFLWGRWDWNSYCGNLFLTGYNPLFYLLTSLIKIVSDLPIELIINVMVFTTYPLSVLVAYFLSYEVSKHQFASLAGSIVFANLNWLAVTVTSAGTLTHLLLFVLVPFTFLCIERYLRMQSLNSFFLATLVFSATLIAHFGFMFYLIPYLCLFLVVKFLQKKSPMVLRALLIIPLSLLVASFFLIPGLYYTGTFGGALISFNPRLSGIEVFMKNLLYLVSNDVGLLALLFQLVAVFIFVRQCRLTYFHKNNQYLPYLILFTLCILWFFPSRLLADFMDNTWIQGDLRLVSLFTGPVLSSYVVKRIHEGGERAKGRLRKPKFQTSHFLIVVAAILLVVQPIPRWSPLRFYVVSDASEFVTSVAEKKVLPQFSDDFSEDMSEWISISGQWEVREDICVGRKDVGEAYCVSRKEFDDFIYETKFKWVSGNLFLGIAFRFLDENNTYLLRWKREWNTLELDKVVDGSTYVIRRWDTTYPIQENTWHTLRVRVINNAIIIYVDSKYGFSALDDTFERGKLGLTVLNGEAAFDDVRVQVFANKSAMDWSRMWLLPRTPAQTMVSLLTKLPTVDGWCDTTANKQIISYLNLIYHKELIDNTKMAIRGLRVLNVEYLFVDTQFTGNNPELWTMILQELHKSDLVEVIYVDSTIEVIQIRNTYPIIASPSVFVINTEDEVTSFYEIISNASFKPHLGIFLFKSGDLTGIEYEVWNGNIEFDEADSVNVTLNEARTEDMDINFNVTVDRECFVSIPISYFEGLKVEVDGRSTKVLKALPGFISFRLTAGAHLISVSRVITPLEISSLAVSTTTFFCLITLLIIDFTRKRKKRALQNYTDHICHIKAQFFLNQSGERVLDVGCGEGAYLKFLHENGKDVIGLELDPRLSRIARNFGEVVLGDVQHLPFREACFDTALLGDLLEHLEDDVKALKETSRVIRGNILLSVPRVELRGHDPTHKRLYSQEKLLSAIQASDLTCTKVQKWFPSPKRFLTVFAKAFALIYPAGFLAEAYRPLFVRNRTSFF